MWVIDELVHMLEYPPYQLLRGFRVFQRDIVSDGIQIAEGGLRPDYLSHRAMRCLAWA